MAVSDAQAGEGCRAGDTSPEDQGDGDQGDPADFGSSGNDACGTGSCADAGPAACDQPLEVQSVAALGQVYWDKDKSSNTFYDQAFSVKFDQPAAGVAVNLLSAGEDLAEVTDDCGRFAFGDLDPGTYAVEVVVPEGAGATSANCPHRFPDAVRFGKVTVVTIGDSLATHGGSPKFPDVLEGILSELAAAESINVAQPGSRSTDWQPGGYLFEQKLEPELDDADVVVITLGGNDISAFIGPALYSGGSLLQKFDELDGFQDELKKNIETIIYEIMERAPHVDVVFCLMLNYAKAPYWEGMFGSYGGLIKALAVNALDKARKSLGEIPGLVVADMAGATEGMEVAGLLADSVHLSSAGHVLYAREIFLALGGVIVSADPLGLERQVGLFSPEGDAAQ